jgi:outer membrane biosynthesis protein TonB
VPFPLQYVGIPKNAPVGAADAFLLRATAAKPIDAPPGVPLAPPDCSVPNREAATRHIEPPPALSAPAAQIASSSLRANVVNVEVEVIIDDLGRVFTARLFTASRIRDLDEGAVYAARHTTYEPGRFRCLPVGGEYKFVVQYVLPMPS